MADNKLQLTDDYKNWLSELKIRIKHAQQKAVLADRSRNFDPAGTLRLGCENRQSTFG